ncbi:hypothetical protein ZWY2020_006435 [Hordeum vulgare]|nr:hypothetical protein ZWY2020_006435 [Hordeum vulgare]
MDVPDAAHPAPAEEVAPAGRAHEPAAEPELGASAIVIPQHGPVAPEAEGRAGGRPMRTWRAANLALVRLPAGTVLSGVPELVMMFASSRSKVEQSARMVCGDMERLEARTEKEASYSADVDRLALPHLKEMDLKDAALREKEEALVQKQTLLAKALESAATLQEEVARLIHASLFPETQITADTAVEVSREERHAAGQEVDTTSGWSVEEIGVGLRARLRALGESVAQLQVVGSSMVAALWPDGVEPVSMSRLPRWLAAGGERLDACRASAARAGAYMALRLAKSWYRDLNLGKLATQRDGSEEELQGMEEAFCVRASTVTEYAAWDDFILKWGEDGGVIAEDLHGLQPCDSEAAPTRRPGLWNMLPPPVVRRTLTPVRTEPGALMRNTVQPPREQPKMVMLPHQEQRPGRPMRPQPRSRCPFVFCSTPGGM